MLYSSIRLLFSNLFRFHLYIYIYIKHLFAIIPNLRYFTQRCDFIIPVRPEWYFTSDYFRIREPYLENDKQHLEPYQAGMK